MAYYKDPCGRSLPLPRHLSIPGVQRRHCEPYMWRAGRGESGGCRPTALTYQCFLTEPRPSQRLRTLKWQCDPAHTVIEFCPCLLSKLHFVTECRIPARYKNLLLPGRDITSVRQSTPALDRFVLRIPCEQHELLLCAGIANHNPHRLLPSHFVLSKGWHVGRLIVDLQPV